MWDYRIAELRIDNRRQSVVCGILLSSIAIAFTLRGDIKYPTVG